MGIPNYKILAPPLTDKESRKSEKRKGSTEKGKTKIIDLVYKYIHYYVFSYIKLYYYEITL